jgi:hypothetical protein
MSIDCYTKAFCLSLFLITFSRLQSRMCQHWSLCCPKYLQVPQSVFGINLRDQLFVNNSCNYDNNNLYEDIVGFLRIRIIAIYFLMELRNADQLPVNVLNDGLFALAMDALGVQDLEAPTAISMLQDAAIPKMTFLAEDLTRHCTVRRHFVIS